MLSLDLGGADKIDPIRRRREIRRSNGRRRRSEGAGRRERARKKED